MPRTFTILAIPLLLILGFTLSPSKNATANIERDKANLVINVFQHPPRYEQTQSYDRYSASFTITLWQLTQASYRYGNSNELNDYLYKKIDARNPFIDISSSVKGELHELLVRLTTENHLNSHDLPKLDHFTVFPDQPGTNEYTIYYAPQRDEIYETSLCLGFKAIETLLNIPTIETYIEIPFSLCGCRYMKLAAEILPDPNPDLDPDLTLEFLKILANPDQRVF